jgi:TRAP-type C4-dicarboxylate transport system permease small subunit
MRRVIQVLADTMLVFTVIALLPFAWLMRDGLGPETTTSSGIQAVSRCFMTFYSGPILIGLIALVVVCHCTGRMKQAETAEPLNHSLGSEKTRLK